jgi:hypothetical protein
MNRTHYFDSTGEAYDACQCDEKISTGDALVIESEQIVGLAYTWPVAITEAYGVLHTVLSGNKLSELTDIVDRTEKVFREDQIEHAKRMAQLHGFTVGQDRGA